MALNTPIFSWVVGITICIAPVHAVEKPNFQRDVRPILAAHCFKCHGPDEAARKGKLRLDTPVDAREVVGKATDSELLRRIHSSDVNEVMPPPAAKKPLSAKYQQVLKAWVATGGQYEEHWAFLQPQRPAVPQLASQPSNPIEAFIRSRLLKENLKSSPITDKLTLIRRVSLDLIGIPPTPAEVDAFLKDTTATAYETLVDRLLASPLYGERWARKWLDLARYADTNGYEKDRKRSIWPYRDWVIKALNADMPFDRFTIEQLAGDLLPNATIDQKIATGFHRNTMLNEEGGIDPLEFRYHAVADRTAVTGSVWLGLTMGCAQCHTHKFDPITHTDYFRFFALLNNAEEPDLDAPVPELVKQQAEIEAAILKQEKELRTHLPAEQRTNAFGTWLAAERKNAITWHNLKPSQMAAGPTKLVLQADGSVFAFGDAQKRDLYSLTLEDLPAGTTALRVEALPDDRLPGNGPGRAYYEGPKGDFLLSEFTLETDGKAVSIASSSETHPRGNLTAKMALDGHPLTGWAGSGRAGVASNAVFVLAKPLTSKAAKLELLFERHYSASLGRFRISAMTTERDVKAREIPGEIEALLAKPAEKITKADESSLFDYWLTIAPELKGQRDAIEALRKKLPRYPTTLVLQERPEHYPRPTYRHHRGEFLSPKEEVTPAVPGFLPLLPKGLPANRLTLAKWIVDPKNPLTARVIVNRHWQTLFGTGIVRTLADFGYQGEAPSHPELLDWLALEFIEKGWSMKKLHKLMVTSATYKQSSRVNEEHLARDPENRLLARASRTRLEAELIRDSALKAAGLLSAKMYGPSVFPPQPPGVTTEGTYGGLNWQVSTGEDRYRRGLYTFAKRTAPYAMFGTFDAPSGEACIVRREVSNTALQALTMLNDQVLLEAAQAIAQLTISHEGTSADRLKFLFRSCLVRHPNVEESAALLRFYEMQRERFVSDPKRAATVAGANNATPERAAWTATARAILNLDEFVTRE